MSTSHRMSGLGKGKGKRVQSLDAGFAAKKIKKEPDENEEREQITGKDYIHHLQFRGNQLTARKLRIFLPEMRKAAYMTSYELKQKKKFKGLWTIEHKPDDWPMNVEFLDPNNCSKANCRKKCAPCTKPDKFHMAPVFDFLKSKINGKQPEDPRDQQLNAPLSDLGQMDILELQTEPNAILSVDGPRNQHSPDYHFEVISDSDGVQNAQFMQQLHQQNGSRQITVQPIKREAYAQPHSDGIVMGHNPELDHTVAPNPVIQFVEPGDTTPMQATSDIQTLTQVKMEPRAPEQLESKIQKKIKRELLKMQQKFNLSYDIHTLLNEISDILDDLFSRKAVQSQLVFRKTGRNFLTMVQDIMEDYGNILTKTDVIQTLVKFKNHNRPGDTDADLNEHMVQTYNVQADLATPILGYTTWIPTVAQLNASQKLRKLPEDEQVMSPGFPKAFEKSLTLTADESENEGLEHDSKDKNSYNLRVRKETQQVYIEVEPRQQIDVEVKDGYQNDDLLKKEYTGILDGFEAQDYLMDPKLVRDLLDGIQKPQSQLETGPEVEMEKSVGQFTDIYTENERQLEGLFPFNMALTKTSLAIDEGLPNNNISPIFSTSESLLHHTETKKEVPLDLLGSGSTLAEIMIAPGGDMGRYVVYLDVNEDEDAIMELDKMEHQESTPHCNNHCDTTAGYNFSSIDMNNVSTTFSNLPVNTQSNEEDCSQQFQFYAKI